MLFVRTCHQLKQACCWLFLLSLSTGYSYQDDPLITSSRLVTDHMNILEAIDGYSADKIMCLFDMDDTLTFSGISEAGHLGGPSWRNDYRRLIHCENKELLFALLTLFFAHYTSGKSVQEGMDAHVKMLKDRAVKPIVLTARGNQGPNAWYTLNVQGVDELSAKQLRDANIAIEKTDIIFCNNKAKDIVLIEWLQKYRIETGNIDLVIFAEDKLSNLDIIEKLVEQIFKNSSFVGIHYNQVEKIEKQSYNLADSTLQLRRMLNGQPLLSEEELRDQIVQDPCQFFEETIEQINTHLFDFYNTDFSVLTTEAVNEKFKDAVMNISW